MANGALTAILEAFDVTGEIIHLKGGWNTSVRVGDTVFKPLDISEDEAEWSGKTLESIILSPEYHPAIQMFRIPRPRRAKDSGKFVYQGWTAADFIVGDMDPRGRWVELITASRGFHEALKKTECQPFMKGRTHAWGIAERVVWEEEKPLRTFEICKALQPVYLRLWNLAGSMPESSPSAVVHSDLCGNVLFHDGQVPAIIDFTPYWQPVEYSEAMIVADGLLFHGAGVELVDVIGRGKHRLQFLVRALMFRVVARSELSPTLGPVPDSEVERYVSATKLVEKLLQETNSS
jgi:uncharacterized protein (TIGR02569 family)